METLQQELATDLDAAFPRLIDEFEDGLFSGVRRLVPQAADAEDVCSEAFLRAYRSLRDMDAERVGSLDLAPWLWTIALNLTRNAARRAARKPWVRLDPSWAGPTAPSPEQSVVGDDQFLELVEELPAGQRAAVVLRTVVGLTYREIAAATGRPEGSVKSDVSRGLDRLRKLEVVI